MRDMVVGYNSCIVEEIKEYLTHADDERDVSLIADYECVRNAIEELIADGMVTIESIKIEPYYMDNYDGPWCMGIDYENGLLFCEEAMIDGKYLMICGDKVFLQKKYKEALDKLEECDVTIFSCGDEEIEEPSEIGNGIHFGVNEKDGKMHSIEFKDDNTYVSFSSSLPISTDKAAEFMDIIKKYFR